MNFKTIHKLGTTLHPWKTISNDEFVVSDDGKPICMFETPTHESRANAKLIAAAPQLYEALLLVVNSCHMPSLTLDIAIEALKAAGGEA